MVLIEKMLGAHRVLIGMLEKEVLNGTSVQGSYAATPNAMR
jgi:hypothetical protein